MVNKPTSVRIQVFIGVLLLGALFIYGYIYQRPVVPESAVVGKKPVLKDGTPLAPQAHVVATSGPSMNETPSILSADDQRKWTILREIVNSKNDNDPRMDKDLKNLSPAFHAEIFKEYQKLPVERRNERGLLSFLIARDLKDPQDFEFLKSIYQESPCLSLGDCSTRAASDPHLAGVDQISQNYPQLSPLQQFKQQVDGHDPRLNDSNYRDQMKGLLSQAANYPVPLVQKKASEILSQIP